MTTTKDDTVLVRAIVAGWNHDTVFALMRMAEMGIAAAKVSDSVVPSPEMRTVVTLAEKAVPTLQRANAVRDWLEKGS